MMAEFPNGYALETMHLPDRKKPVLRLTLHGQYKGHAVFSDEDSCDEFMAFMVTMWAGRNKRGEGE